MSDKINYCGFVTIVGRPNVGKSTLLNKLLGNKVSITSSKPQTTRHRIIGINTELPYQAIYVDTPGLHIEKRGAMAINRLMNRVASSSIFNVDLVIFVVEGTHWTNDDEMVMNKLHDLHCPIVLSINKVDHVIDKKTLLPHMLLISKKINFKYILPICANNGMNVDTLADIVYKELPAAVHYFPKYYITNRSQLFILSEIIREKLMRFFGGELPYYVTVEIERFTTNSRGYDISGLIMVERYGHKKMVIGHKGSKIKTIGIQARKDMEAMFDTRVSLALWVKVKSCWTDDERYLRSIGYVSD